MALAQPHHNCVAKEDVPLTTPAMLHLCQPCHRQPSSCCLLNKHPRLLHTKKKPSSWSVRNFHPAAHCQVTRTTTHPHKPFNNPLTTVDQCFNTSCVTPSPFLSHSNLSFLSPSTPTPTPDNWKNARMHLQHHTVSLYSVCCTPRAPLPCAPS